jgi:hypothetical protein
MDAGGAQDLEPPGRGMRGRGFENGRLPDSRRAANQQRSAFVNARAVDTLRECPHFTVATDHRSSLHSL